MAEKLMKTKAPVKRLSTLTYKGHEILYIDLSGIEREEGTQVLAEFVAQLKSMPENSVRVLMNTTNAVHDSRGHNQWKAMQPVISQYVLKAGVFGLSPLMKIAYSGYRMAAGLMGQENSDKLGKAFSSQAEAMDYLVS